MLRKEPELAYSKDKRGISALFHAVANGHNKIVEIILNITEQANDVEPEKRCTPLIIAATNGHIALVRPLLEHGAEPNLRNFDGVTALHHAVYQNQLDIVAMLLDAGADPNIKDRLGYSAHDLAQRSGNPKLMGWFQRDRKDDFKLLKDSYMTLLDDFYTTFGFDPAVIAEHRPDEVDATEYYLFLSSLGLRAMHPLPKEQTPRRSSLLRYG